MAKFQTYNIGPVNGTAFTKTEARASAERRAGEALTRLDEGFVYAATPPTITSEVVAIVVAPTMRDWGYKLVRGDARRDTHITASGYEERKVALYKAVEHYLTAYVPTPMAEDNATHAIHDALVTWAADVLRDEGLAVMLGVELSRGWRNTREYFRLLNEGRTAQEAHAIVNDAPHLDRRTP